MRKVLVLAGIVVVFVFSVIPSHGLAQKKKQSPACSDVPVMASFYNGLAIQNDQGWYENGVGGVSAVPNTCNGTNDITITTGSNRAFVYTFPDAVPDSSPADEYLSPGNDNSITVSSSLFVRNILYNPSGRWDSEYSFTSDAWFTFGDYRLRFVGPNDADLLWFRNQFLDDNQNLISSNVTVTFHPADPDDPGDYGSWTISGTNLDPDGYLQLGTLHGYFNGKIKWVHLGQYEMPFKLEVKALRPF